MPKKKSLSDTTKRSLEAKDFYSDYESPSMLYAVLVRSPAATGKVTSIKIPDLPEGYFLYTASDIPGNKTVEINKTSVKIFGYKDIHYFGEPLGILCGPDENKLHELLETVVVNFDVKSLESALKKVMTHQKRPIALQENTDTPTELSDFVSSINDLPSLDTVVDNTHTEEDFEKVIASREIKYGLYTKMEVQQAEDILFNIKKEIETENQNPSENSEIDEPQDSKTQEAEAEITVKTEAQDIQQANNDEKDIIYSTETWHQSLKSPSWKETTGAFCSIKSVKNASGKEDKKLHIYTPSKWTGLLMNIVSQVLKIPAEDIYLHKTKSSGTYSQGIWRTSILAAQVALASYLSKKDIKLVLTQAEQDMYMSPAANTNITYHSAVTKEGKIQALSVKIDIDVGACNPFAQEITDRLSLAVCNYYQPENLYIQAKARTSKNPPTSLSIKSVDCQAFFAIENQMQQFSELVKLYPEEIRRVNIPAKNSDYPIRIPTDSVFETFSQAMKMSDFNRKYASFHMDAIDRLKKNSNPFFALPLRGIGIASAFNTSVYNGNSAFSYSPKVEITLINEDKAVIHCIKPSAFIQDIWKNTVAEILGLEKKNISIDSTYSLEEIPDSPEDTFNTIGTINELIKKCCTEIQKKKNKQDFPITVKKTPPATSKKNWDKDKFEGSPFNSVAHATTVVELELDSYTYSEKIKGIWISLDCGKIYDEVAAKKTVLLEVQQELSMLVDGKIIPCDNINISFIQKNETSGQVGELVHNTLPAAFTTALSSALATQLTELPCTEKQIFELIKERETEV